MSNKYKSVWMKISGSPEVVGDDNVFVPIGPEDRKRLVAALQAAILEDRQNDDEDAIHPDEEFWLERLTATHFCIAVAIPQDDGVMIQGGTAEERRAWLDTEATWWDFSSVLARQVDGEWEIWVEGPSDIGNIWFQSCYYKHQAYAVRDAAVQWAKEDRLLSGTEYLASDFGHEWDKIMGE